MTLVVNPSITAFYPQKPNGIAVLIAPGAFIVLADDDPYGLQNHGPRFYRALRAANVPSELHVFVKGKHGFGVRRPAGPISGWMNLFSLWLDQMGISGG